MPSPEPAASTLTAPTAPPSTSFVCGEPLEIADPQGKKWALTYLSWGPRGDFERVTLRLVRDSRAPGDVARALVTSYPPADVQLEVGVPGPSVGRTAIVVALGSGVRVGGGIGVYRPTTLRAVKEWAPTPVTPRRRSSSSEPSERRYRCRFQPDALEPSSARTTEVVVDIER
jgi:hypothetical protein